MVCREFEANLEEASQADLKPGAARRVTLVPGNELPPVISRLREPAPMFSARGRGMA